MKNRIIVLLLGIGLVLGLAACSSAPDSAAPEGDVAAGEEQDAQDAGEDAAAPEDGDAGDTGSMDGLGNGSITFYDHDGELLSADQLGGYVFVDYTIHLKGQAVALPCTVAEVLAPFDVRYVAPSALDNYDWDEIDQFILSPDDAENITVYTHEDQAFTIEVENTGSGELPFMDCTVTGFRDAIGGHYDQDYLRILNGQVRLGMPLEEFLEVVGEENLRTDTYDKVKMQSYSVDDTFLSYNIEFEDDVLRRIHMYWVE